MIFFPAAMRFEFLFYLDSLEHSNFGFVSYFVFRISDFVFRISDLSRFVIGFLHTYRMIASGSVTATRQAGTMVINTYGSTVNENTTASWYIFISGFNLNDG